jgi:magnesium-transporting ATPase (P-type)
MDRNEGEEARREVVRSIERKEGVVVRMTEDIIILITSSSLLLSFSFTFVTSSFLSSSFKSPLHYLFHYFLIIILLTISILKTLLSDKAIFLSASEKNSSLLSAGRHS